MRLQLASMLFLCLFVLRAAGQQISAPEPQPATISGTVTDKDNGVIPGASIAIDSDSPGDHRTSTSASDGSFLIGQLRPGVAYHIVIHANGFADYMSQVTPLTPGQRFQLPDIKLAVGAVQTSITAVSQEELALEQVKDEEHQRVFGFIPNFYVVYDQRFVPLSSKLKFQLALRTSIDVVNFSASGVLAGINQAADISPHYKMGAAGYGKRYAAVYGGGVANIFIGGAILPSLLHQDPRYFYQGTGTHKSRALHAISAPFVTKGDNGKWQPNYSSIVGDFASGALDYAYYPDKDRGPGIVVGSALLSTGGRVVNALIQEFILSKYTSRGKSQSASQP